MSNKKPVPLPCPECGEPAAVTKAGPRRYNCACPDLVHCTFLGFGRGETESAAIQDWNNKAREGKGVSLND